MLQFLLAAALAAATHFGVTHAGGGSPPSVTSYDCTDDGGCCTIDQSGHCVYSGGGPSG